MKIKLRNTNYIKTQINKNSELYNTLIYQHHITDHLFCQVTRSNYGQGQLQKLYLQVT
jgi:hypothetical protein